MEKKSAAKQAKEQTPLNKRVSGRHTHIKPPGGAAPKAPTGLHKLDNCKKEAETYKKKLFQAEEEHWLLLLCCLKKALKGTYCKKLWHSAKESCYLGREVLELLTVSTRAEKPINRAEVW